MEIIFTGDLVGFTSWSSSREPAQVFTLLETLFHAFDKAARKYGVFKGKKLVTIHGGDVGFDALFRV